MSDLYTMRILVKNGGAMLVSRIVTAQDFKRAAQDFLDFMNVEVLTDTGWNKGVELWRRKVVQVPAYGELSFVLEFTAKEMHR